MDKFIIYASIAGVVFLICFVIFILVQMGQFKRNYPLSNKPIEKMDKKEVLFSLQSEELNTTRWIEDIIELLIAKRVLEKEELPITVQTRIAHKNELRKRLEELNKGKGEK